MYLVESKSTLGKEVYLKMEGVGLPDGIATCTVISMIEKCL